MKIECAGTGSTGNCYILTDKKGNQCVLDCGVSYKKLLKADLINDRPDLALVTHKHKDHSGHIKDFTDRGIPVFVPMQVKLDGYASSYLVDALMRDKEGRYAKEAVETWQFFPFRIDHEKNVENVGYIVYSSVNDEGVVYITDASSISYGSVTLNKKPLSEFIIEVNYDDETLERNVKKTGDQNLYRQAKRHMSLKKAVRWLSLQDLSGCSSIHVCHMSDRNCNEEKVKRTLKERFGKEIIIF